MRYLYLALGVILIGGIILFSNRFKNNAPLNPPPDSDSLQVTVIAENLDIPWDIAFLPDGDLLVTERPGTLLRLGQDQKQYPIQGVEHHGEGGLLGITLHPNFSQNHWLYLYLTTRTDSGLINRVERYEFNNNTLTSRTEIITNIPGASHHDGGRLEFGLDGYLYITTGDAGNEDLAQDKNSLAGKILRLKDDGSIPADNPFNSAIYSYGHRNPQGLAWDNQGQLWSTEHGRSGIQSGYDEINLIKKGQNYGWPIIQGDEQKEGLIAPIRHSGSTTTWAPASATFWDNTLLFAGLRGARLYQAVLDGNQVTELKEYFINQFGRIRTVRIGPDNQIYLTTSNTDGRGNPLADDDKVIRLSPAALH